jgi:hypothetical protein
MKHLKLFEAFNSNILSKTLKYLSKKSKDSFLKEVKQICDEMDFPYSKLSDEYFEYLPFNNALKKVDGDNKIYKFWLNSAGDLINTTLTDGEILNWPGYDFDLEVLVEDRWGGDDDEFDEEIDDSKFYK